MLYCLPVSLHERFHRTGSHLVNTDHQIDLGKLLLRQGFLHRDLFLLPRHRYYFRIEHLINRKSGRGIKCGGLFQSTIFIHSHCPGIPDKYSIIKIAVIHRMVDHFFWQFFRRLCRLWFLRCHCLCLRICRCLSDCRCPTFPCGIFCAFRDRIPRYGSVLLSGFRCMTHPGTGCQLHTPVIQFPKGIRIHLPVVRPCKKQDSHKQQTDGKG